MMSVVVMVRRVAGGVGHPSDAFPGRTGPGCPNAGDLTRRKNEDHGGPRRRKVGHFARCAYNTGLHNERLVTGSPCVMAGAGRPPTSSSLGSAKSWVAGPSPAMTRYTGRWVILFAGWYKLCCGRNIPLNRRFEYWRKLPRYFVANRPAYLRGPHSSSVLKSGLWTRHGRDRFPGCLRSPGRTAR
jgi:hypothetical protein